MRRRGATGCRQGVRFGVGGAADERNETAAERGSTQMASSRHAVALPGGFICVHLWFHCNREAA